MGNADSAVKEESAQGETSTKYKFWFARTDACNSTKKTKKQIPTLTDFLIKTALVANLNYSLKVKVTIFDFHILSRTLCKVWRILSPPPSFLCIFQNLDRYTQTF